MIKPKLLVVAHTNLGTSLSGGDRIFLNILKYWQKHFDINILASTEAKNLVRHFKLHPKITITVSKTSPIKTLNTFNLFVHHLFRFISGLNFCFTHQKIFKQAEYIYTASDFYGDFVFGFIAKIIKPKIVWICGYYLLAPNPFDQHSPYIQNKHFFRGLIYYIAQLPSVFITKLLADYVLVTSNPDISVFQNRYLDNQKILVVQGGVFIPSVKILKLLKPVSKRKYDALYIGRLHSQKGVLEMVDIWQKVVNVLPEAKLSIIGDGELMDKLIEKINQNNLNKNITVIGFMIGKKKFDIIKESKIILHPATYDSGGMAAAEAMAWGLPGISFDLEALKTYYPQGMIKTPCFDQNIFTQNIIKLLTDSKFYQHYSQQARSLTISNWNWKKRLNKIYQTIISK